MRVVQEFYALTYYAQSASINRRGRPVRGREAVLNFQSAFVVATDRCDTAIIFVAPFSHLAKQRKPRPIPKISINYWSKNHQINV